MPVHPPSAVVVRGLLSEAGISAAISMARNKFEASGHRNAVQRIQDDMRRFREERDLKDLVMINLASVERMPERNAAALQSRDAFERGLDSDDKAISPAMLYAYAAIMSDTPYGNFTPSVAADLPVLAELAAEREVPIAGKDGKPDRRS